MNIHCTIDTLVLSHSELSKIECISSVGILITLKVIAKTSFSQKSIKSKPLIISLFFESWIFENAVYIICWLPLSHILFMTPQCRFLTLPILETDHGIPTRPILTLADNYPSLPDWTPYNHVNHPWDTQSTYLFHSLLSQWISRFSFINSERSKTLFLHFKKRSSDRSEVK